MNEQLKKLLERTLQASETLANAASVTDGKFLVTLLGIYRVSFTTLGDIYYLSSNEGAGPSILDLTRKIIEHGITVEYMLLKGKEEMAERFQEYLPVQMHDRIEFLKSIGQDTASLNDELREGFEENEKIYVALGNRIKKDKTWAGRSVEQMFADLRDANALKEFDFSRGGEAYVWGCLLNHPNPLVVRNYLEPEANQAADDFYIRLGMLVAIVFHLRLATRLIDESRFATGSNIYLEIATGIQAIQKELNDMGQA